MSETTKRAELADVLRHLFGTSATCIVPYREAIAEFVDALIDATKDEIRAELAPRGGAAPAPVAYVTCQCREPELYVPADGGIICNQCGYEYTADWSKLPSRAPRRDFGAHVCLCNHSVTMDGATCVGCGATLYGPNADPAYRVSEHGE